MGDKAMSGTIGRITENTLIPLSLVGCIVGGTAWLTTMHGDIHSHTEVIQDIKAHQEVIAHTLEKINERLSKIEGKLEEPS